MKGLHIVTFILLVVGGLNWGLVGIGVGDIVTRLLGDSLAHIVFIVVGLAAIVELVTHKKCCTMCSSKGMATGGAM